MTQTDDVNVAGEIDVNFLGSSDHKLVVIRVPSAQAAMILIRFSSYLLFLTTFAAVTLETRASAHNDRSKSEYITICVY